MWARTVTNLGNKSTLGQCREVSRLARRRQLRRKKMLLWGGVIVGTVGVWKALDYAKDYFQQHTEHSDTKEKIVVVGTGFGSLSLVSELDCDQFDVSIVSPRGYFLYTPLLASATVGALSTESIVEPIHSFGDRTGKKFRYYEAECVDVNMKDNSIACKPVQSIGSEFNLPYDQLVLSVGAINNTKGVKGVENCNFLNSLNDARRVRNRIIDAFEASSLDGISDEKKSQLLHFVVVGGGPIARTTATQLQAYINEKVETSYPHLKEHAKVSLINTVDHIHNYYDHALSNYYRRKFKQTGVEELDVKVLEVTPDSLKTVDDNNKSSELPFGLCIWSTGKAPHPLVAQLREKLPEQKNKQALLVKPNLQLEGSKNIYAIGDCSTMDQNYFLPSLEKIFEEADANKDGVLDIHEVSLHIKKLGNKYPALLEIEKRAKELFESVDVNKDGTLTKDEFKEFLSLVDETTTRLPGTASVAVQEGQYVARQFNSGAYKALVDVPANKIETAQGFRYKHIGGYEYVGAELGQRERGSKGDKIMKGFGAWWMWNNVYYSVLVGVPMRLRISASKLYHSVYGREASRY